MELDPRTSMERHLMDRDREGQLYLESRRQQAAQELLSNRASFLSTITPPSTSPSSAASSLFREPLSTSSVAATAASAAGSAQGEDIEVLESPITPTTPALPTTLLIPPPAITATTTTATTPTTPTFLNVTSPFQSFVPSIKSRQRSATSHGRVLEVPDRPLVAISPSSLEYQLTASLLSYRQPPPPSPRDPNSAGSRSKARLLNIRRATISSDVRIDSLRLAEATAAALLEASSSTVQPGHRRKRGSKDSNIPDNVEMYRKGHDEERLELPRRKFSPRELTSTSLPSSPTGTHAQFGYQGAAPFSDSSEYPLPQHPLHLLQQQQHPHVVTSSSSVHPTSPLPPKSPRSLIAHYFPGSLPPPPSRNRGLARNREPLVAPTPFRTPTFGPQVKQDTNSPALPSPSGSFHCIPSTTISRSSTAQPHAPEDKDSDALSSRPSPSTSAIGISTSAGKQPHQRHHPYHSQPSRQPCDQDACGSRGCFHNHIQHTIHNLARNQYINNFVYGGCITAEDSTPTPPTPTAVTESPTASGSGSGSGSGGLLISAPAAVGGAGPSIRRASSAAALTTSPVYPSPLADYRHPAIIRLQQKPVPYVRELVPGREDQAMASPRSGPPSVNTSRDLESVLEGVNGRHRNNRMSLDPWSYYASTLEEKRNPSFRREQGSRYWVFRDQNGIVPGPFLFLFGFLLPFLWWIGSVYPHQEHPDSQPLSEQGTVDEYDHAKKSGYPWAIQWLQKRIAFITGGDMDKRPTMTIAHLHNVRISQDTDREGSTLEPPGHINASTNASATHIPLPPIHTIAHGRADTHGPWSADDHAASLYEQRLEHTRKVWRYELDMRWKRINLISSFGSFVLAILITAFVIGFS